MEKKYYVFEAHPYEGYWDRGFDSLKEAREYVETLLGDPDVVDVKVVKNMGA